MVRSHLRVYYGPPAEKATATIARDVAQTVTVPLSDVLPLLADAFNSRRTRLGDFSDDPVTISTDLYEVILAYQHFRRPSA